MQFSNLLSALAFLGAATANTLAGRGCFPDNTHQLVQNSQVVIGNLINNIFQQDNSTGKANYINANKALDSLKAEVRTDSPCNNPTPSPWPTHLSPVDSQSRAIDILRSSQDVLIQLDQDVIECDKESVERLFCTATGLVENIEGYYGS